MARPGRINNAYDKDTKERPPETEPKALEAIKASLKLNPDQKDIRDIVASLEKIP
jgi:hypothetical protein